MTSLTQNQTAVLNAVRTGSTTTAEVAKSAGVCWHSANVAIKALAKRGLVQGTTGQLAPAAGAREPVGEKRLTRNQFKVYMAIATGSTTTSSAARRAQVVWHSANVAVKALIRKGMVAGSTGSLEVRRIEDLGSVVFVQDQRAVA